MGRDGRAVAAVCGCLDRPSPQPATGLGDFHQPAECLPTGHTAFVAIDDALGVQDWLRKKGYPFEMRVARAFDAGRGLGVVQGDYFVDPEEAKPRDIDVVATRSVAFDTTTNAIVACTVECKSNRGRPFVGFVRRRPTAASIDLLADQPGTRSGRAWVRRALFHESVRAERLLTFDVAAYAVTQASSSGNADNAYEACHSATKSAVAIANRWEKDSSDVGVILPVVTVDGQLFTAQLGTDGGDVEVAETDRMRLLWRYPHVDSGPTLVTIVSERGLDRFVADFVSLAETLLGRIDEAREALTDPSVLGIY